MGDLEKSIQYFSKAYNEYNISNKLFKASMLYQIIMVNLMIANFENAAKKKEAAAIHFYSKNLNMREEVDPGDRDYGFRSIESQIGIGEILSKKGKTGAEYSRTDADRQTVIGENTPNIGCFHTELRNKHCFSPHLLSAVSDTPP